MGNNDRISRLAHQLGERLQGASQAPEELQRGVQQVVRGAFDRLELVSREDFDILMDVLQRTRGRVEALEQQVAALEAALDGEARPAAPKSAAAEATAPEATAIGPGEDAGAGEVSAGDGATGEGTTGDGATGERAAQEAPAQDTSGQEASSKAPRDDR